MKDVKRKTRCSKLSSNSSSSSGSSSSSSSSPRLLGCETFSVALKEVYRFAQGAEKFIFSRSGSFRPTHPPILWKTGFLEYKAARA
jgi:hypothetical protein